MLYDMSIKLMMNLKVETTITLSKYNYMYSVSLNCNDRC